MRDLAGIQLYELYQFFEFLKRLKNIYYGSTERGIIPVPPYSYYIYIYIYIYSSSSIVVGRNPPSRTNFYTIL